jgi:DNA-binding transcriptional ArsR family regulator
MQIGRSAGRELAPLAGLFERLSNPTRLRLLCALADGRAHSLGGLAGAAGVTRPTVSRHLGELARIGLVTEERSGPDKRFALHPLVRRGDGLLNLGRGVRIACCEGDCTDPRGSQAPPRAPAAR